MYYLKYRPQSIEELDNTGVKEKLQALFKSKEIPHAFLFVGQKGMGKTSVARIIAKKLNEKNKIDPLKSPDVIEMDAASNRGVDDIKSLIKEASFVPVASDYRVFIIDEAHMITNEGFNALLKTLEEPPKTAIFILATTNEEKLPKTIISRCYRMAFGKAKHEDVVNMLKRIVKKEKLSVEQEVLDLIALSCDLSFRDGAKLLEELVAQNKLTLSAAQEYLGLTKDYNNFLKILKDKQLKDALLWIDNFVKDGGSIKVLLEELMNELRFNLLANNEIKVEKTPEIFFSNKQIIQLLKLFNNAYVMLNSSPIESIPIEIAVVEFYNDGS